MLATRTLVIAGEGGVHTKGGKRVALLRAYDKATGADVGAVEMPAKQTGSPMTYMVNGRQYIVVAVSGRERQRVDRLRAAAAVAVRPRSAIRCPQKFCSLEQLTCEGAGRPIAALVS